MKTFRRERSGEMEDATYRLTRVQVDPYNEGDHKKMDPVVVQDVRPTQSSVSYNGSGNAIVHDATSNDNLVSLDIDPFIKEKVDMNGRILRKYGRLIGETTYDPTRAISPAILLTAVLVVSSSTVLSSAATEKHLSPIPAWTDANELLGDYPGLAKMLEDAWIGGNFDEIVRLAILWRSDTQAKCQSDHPVEVRRMV